MKRENGNSTNVVLSEKKDELNSRNIHHVVTSSLTAPEIEKLVYDLEVRLWNFENQSEELLRLKAAAESDARKLSAICDFAAVGYYILNPDGTISELNSTGAGFTGKGNINPLINRKFRLFSSTGNTTGF